MGDSGMSEKLSADTHKRSIVKAIIYRCGGIAVLAAVTWIFTQDVIQVTAVTVVYHLVSVVGYYVYERIWGHMKWGKGIWEGYCDKTSML